MGIIVFLLIGALAGWLAGNFMKGDGFGLFGNIGVGILGSFIGGFVFNLVGISVGGFIGNVIMATVGAALLLFLLDLIKK